MGSHCCSNQKSSFPFYHNQASSTPFNGQDFAQKYSFGKIIGIGSYCQVKVAHDNLQKQKYAVKIIDKAGIIKNKTYPHVLNQKKILKILNSDRQMPKNSFIVQLKECIQDRYKLYFVLEYLPYGNVRSLLNLTSCKQYHLTQEKIKFLTICVLLAMAQLDKHKIIHGDIKPENILMDKDGYFKLVDFSSAQRYDCYSNLVRGTTGYIAPQIKKSPSVKLSDNKSDLYSLGTILWQLAYGIKYSKFIGEEQKSNESINLTQHSSDQQDPSVNVSPLCQNFISSLLMQNRQKRSQLNEVWGHPWLNLSEEQKQKYVHKNVQTNPFTSGQGEFNILRNNAICSQYKYRKINGSQFSDDLLTSVILNQKKIQDIFSSFSSVRTQSRDMTNSVKSHRSNSSLF